MGGVTAAAAISALQEAGNKTTRACIKGTYTAYVQIMCQVIELIRQFYVGVRTFRVSDHTPGGMTASRSEAKSYRYIRFSHGGLQNSTVGQGADGEERMRQPMFDLEVRAERENPLDRNNRNEMMLRLYECGLLAEGRETEALRALSGMDFEGIDTLRHSLTEHENP